MSQIKVVNVWQISVSLEELIIITRKYRDATTLTCIYILRGDACYIIKNKKNGNSTFSHTTQTYITCYFIFW